MDVKKLETFVNNEYGGSANHPAFAEISGVDKLLRISFCYYNTSAEVDVLEEVIQAFIRKNG